ncbi:hypothetical protein MJ8_07530 [Mesorhizobium sp. J8]|nr:hypothetical protein MJ8_07530 [Mesorhizobium sp. J8]
MKAPPDNEYVIDLAPTESGPILRFTEVGTNYGDNACSQNTFCLSLWPPAP